MLLRICLIVLVAFQLGGRLVAHHSFAAEFDEQKPVTLRGTVVRMDWVNPHCWLHLEVKRDDGTVAHWMIEGGAPNALLRRGWTKKSLLPGTEIVVEGYRARNGELKASGRDVRLADGRKLFFDLPSEDGRPREKFEITAGWPPDEFDPLDLEEKR
jgi:hypothetical protein